MSYLLEALRKAERDRQLGQPPSLQAAEAPAGQPPRDQRRLVLALAATAVMLLSLVLVLLLTRQSAPAAAPVPAAPIAAPLPEPEPAGPSSLDELAAVQPPTPEPLVEPAPVRAPARAAAPRRREAAKPEPEPARELAAPDLPEQAAPESDPIKEEPPSAPPLRELPADYRADFPALSIEVHVYDADPAKRWIMVNTRRYREGETLSEGPRVVEIRADGVVFEHRGQRALVTVVR